MMLLEHDAKQLLALRAIPVPWGVLADDDHAPLDDLPGSCWVVKAQVAIGGRGKAGGILKAGSATEIKSHLGDLLGSTLQGHVVNSCRVEACVAFVAEAYVSLSIDAGRGGVVVLMSAAGGVDIESAAGRAGLLSAATAPDAEAVGACIDRLAEALPADVRAPIADAAHALSAAFFAYEATLLEVNPLFIQFDGAWIAGDAKLVIDESSLPRQPEIQVLLNRNARAYPQAALKEAWGFDYVCLDADGDIGLITTGAGLTMQLIDELVALGARPYNFCDIRTAQFRGDPARLIQVMRWIAQGPRVRSVLINFFAGMTDLGEIAGLLLAALNEVKELRVPVTARLIGNGLDKAIDIMAAADNPIRVETDLDAAMAQAVAAARSEGAIDA